MKKLLLTSAVLVGMGASQAFAAASDSWTNQIDLTIGNQCVLSAATVSLGGGVDATLSGSTYTFDATQTANASNGVDTDQDGLADNNFAISILFDTQSYCNYAHNMSLGRQFGGFRFSSDSDALAGGSDEFLSAIPYALTVSANSWNTDATTTINGDADLVQESLANVAPYVGTAHTWANSADTAQALAIPRFHNDGITTTGANSTDGLQVNLAFTAADLATSDAVMAANPLMAGLYSERLILQIGAAL